MASLEPNAPTKDLEHESRTVSAIGRALRDIPFYAKRGGPPVDEKDTLGDVLAKTPLLFKSHLRSALPKHWVPAGRDVKAELASGELELVETSGSTGDRTRILWDKGWWLHQEERGIRTNPLASRAFDGAHGEYKEAILTTPVCGLGVCHIGDVPFEERVDGRWLFLNMRPDPAFWKPSDMTRMIEEIARHKTVGLESDPNYLAALARHATRTGQDIRLQGFATLTYSMTSATHLRAIRKAVEVPIFQLYGASEVGVLFMEGEDHRLHHCPFTTHVEYLYARGSTPGAKNVALAVVTTLDRVAQPLVRFVAGDLMQVDKGAPGQFTTVSPVVSMEGRIHDAILRPDGALDTAGAIDRALAPLLGIAGYQVNQRKPGEAELDLIPEDDAPASLEDDAREILEPLLSGLKVTARKGTAINAEASGKYRLVRRHFAIDMGSFFSECEGVSL
jgi:phenylacetate-CoA ligase